MQLKTENYKGIAIRVIQNIIGNKKVVLAKWVYKGRPYETKALTKMDAVAKAKRVIDRIL